jgi:hypothetical protein
MARDTQLGLARENLVGAHVQETLAAERGYLLWAHVQETFVAERDNEALVQVWAQGTLAAVQAWMCHSA